MQTVSLLGCGWVGYALALELLSQKHYKIKASTTTKDKLALFEEKNIQAFLIDSQNNNVDTKVLGEFLSCDILIISLPPKKDNVNYLKFLEQIASHKNIARIHQVIFISSTSVYPFIEKNISENESISTENTSKKVVYEAEQIFLQKKIDKKISKKINLVILRCSGLMGYNRIAGKYFANKEIQGENDCVNYVHRDDVIAIISLLIEKKIVAKIYNL
ncbi:MAG: hypothetical protein HRT43_10815 [Campylobacteraceae bacterium]|nr:hypothetical protein [Campylobacteraceae bacterium]